MDAFKGKTCIITGASAGIGLALTGQLASQGARVVLAARDQSRLDEIAARLNTTGARTLGIATDVGDPLSCERLIRRTIDAFGGIDMLINNAGLTMLSRFDELEDVALLEKVLRVNFLGSVYCTYYALPYLKESKGRIVAVSSISGFTGLPYRSAYSASKHAMVGFFDTLRLELATTGVSVTTVFPGFVRTDIRDRAIDGSGMPLQKQYVDESHSMAPETCAKIILRAAERRKTLEIITVRGKLGRYIKVLFPRVADWMVRRSIRRGN